MNSSRSDLAPSGKRYLAHVRQDGNGPFVIHELEEHLRLEETWGHKYDKTL